jgi:hypothetical protein
MMSKQSLIYAFFTAVGVFTLVNIIGEKLAREYGLAQLRNLDMNAISSFSNASVASTFLAVLLACFFAIGFANRAGASRLNKIVFGFVVATPVIILATYPKLSSFDLDADNVKSLVFYGFSAILGLLIGLRFNHLQKL